MKNWLYEDDIETVKCDCGSDKVFTKIWGQPTCVFGSVYCFECIKLLSKIELNTHELTPRDSTQIYNILSKYR